MSKISRRLLAVSAGALLLGASGCALPGAPGDSDASEQSREAQTAGLEQFDPCSFFKPDELKGWGISAEAEDSTQVSWEPGCKWNGDKTTIGINKNAEETVESYEQNGSWDSYEKTKLSGRAAAVAKTADANASGMGCNILVNSGGGVAIYQITVDATESVDACGELKKIAESTASRLPA